MWIAEFKVVAPGAPDGSPWRGLRLAPSNGAAHVDR